MLGLALLKGAPGIRTGLEDVAYISKGVHAPSNAALVEMAVGLAGDARARGRDPGADHGSCCGLADAAGLAATQPVRGRAAPARRGPETREAIHAAAIELFAQLGYHATSMRAIAAAAARAAGGDLPLVSEQGGDPGPPPGRLHGAAHRARRRGDGAPATARRCGWPPRSASTSSSTASTAARRSSPTARSGRSPTGPRRALIAKRDDYQAMFGEMIRDGIRDGSLRASDAARRHLRDPAPVHRGGALVRSRGPLKLEQVAELHVELVLGSLRASPELIAEAIESVSREAERGSDGSRDDAIKPPALPEKATIAVVAPASPPQTRSELEQATAVLRGARPRGRLRAQPPQGPRLSGRDRRRARRRPAVGALASRGSTWSTPCAAATAPPACTT